MSISVTHKHALIGMTVQAAIRLVCWGNSGELVIIDRDLKTIERHGRGGDLVARVVVKDGKIVRIGNIE